MKTSLANFIPINRKVFKHQFWEEERIYSRFEAWLDLIASASYDTKEKSKIIDKQLVCWQRGQLVASLRYLATRWGWGKTKVTLFINLLKRQNMIKTETAYNTKATIITICNYETYNVLKKSTRQPAIQSQDNDETVTRQRQDKTNKENKDEKSKEREIYRGFAHLCLFTDDYLKLVDKGFTPAQIDRVLDDVENYSGNKKYSSLYLTTKAWLLKQKKQVAAAAHVQPAPTGRIVNIASAFEEALQHG